jgi:hypothetical protein
MNQFSTVPHSTIPATDEDKGGAPPAPRETVASWDPMAADLGLLFLAFDLPIRGPDEELG